MSKNKSGYMNAKDIAKEAATEAVKEYIRQEKDRLRKRRYHNMGLLMDNYLEFLEHYKEIKYKASEIADDLALEEFDEVYLDDIYIEAIKKSKVRTMIMIRLIESSIDRLRNTADPEKVKVIEKLYMDLENKKIKFNARVSVVAEQIPCSERTVRRWNTEMLNELAKKIFGVDGLRIEF